MKNNYFIYKKMIEFVKLHKNQNELNLILKKQHRTI